MPKQVCANDSDCDSDEMCRDYSGDGIKRCEDKPDIGMVAGGVTRTPGVGVVSGGVVSGGGKPYGYGGIGARGRSRMGGNHMKFGPKDRRQPHTFDELTTWKNFTMPSYAQPLFPAFALGLVIGVSMYAASLVIDKLIK